MLVRFLPRDNPGSRWHLTQRGSHSQFTVRAFCFETIDGCILLLIGWSWTGGFVVGSLSRRTLWASTLLCYSPCLFCLSRFRVASLSRFCLLLFLVPAIWGVYRGLRISRMKLGWAIALAITNTALMLPGWSSGAHHWWAPPRWTLDWVLCWPAWYLVTTARRAGSKAGLGGSDGLWSGHREQQTGMS